MEQWNSSARWRGKPALLAGFLGIALCTAMWAMEPKESPSYLDQKAFFKPELYITSSHVPVDQVLDRLPNRSAWAKYFEAQEKAVGPTGEILRPFLDPRSGATTNLIGSFPLLPGRGAGNHVQLADLAKSLGHPIKKLDPGTVGEAVLAFIRQNGSLLGIDQTQLGAVRAVEVTGELWQINLPQVYKGVAVRWGRLAATINNGNLTLIGCETWGDVKALSTIPKITGADAMARGFAYAGGRSSVDEILRQPTLEVIPVAPQELQGDKGFAGKIGEGYRHRLVWSYVFHRPPDEASWEILVDAHSGEVLSLQDINQYATQSITGGVYPISNTGICPNNASCGTMQTGSPMPFADTGLPAPNNFTNSAGLFDFTSGTVTTTLTGRFVDIVDNCGAVTNSSTSGSLNLGGTNGQHDCTTGGGSAGNTPASRTAFYEVNKMAEMARGWLPNNTWLQSRLTTNVNINATCNAFFNGTSINFYRSGGGCGNTGEIAGVFDHEWGHGLDANDAGGASSNSGEAYADVAAIYRLQASCIGHGFNVTNDRGCGQTADGTGFNANEARTGPVHCDLDCSGVRDADWDRHADHAPDTPLGFVCNSCTTGGGPCGREVHCAAAPVRQAAWDLVARDLAGAPFNLDRQSAFLVASRLFFQGSGNVGAWHSCTCGSASSGCGATNGYMQWLAADDDNGNLNDGTPHMTAIFNAFNRHGIACATPAPVNSGCSGAPTASPTLAATPGDRQASLAWNTVTGATRFWVFRTEGHAGCDLGKARIGQVTTSSFTDTQVANGRSYFYSVVAAGTSDACFTRASNCVTVVPTAPAADFTVACSPTSVSVAQGGSGTTTCTVTSQNGFNSAVSLSCSGLPAGASCSFSPASLTPPAGGSASSTLTISATATANTGTSNISVVGASGATSHSTAVSLTISPTATPDFTVACSPASLSAAQGASASSTCTVSSQNGFNNAVSLSCSGLAAGVGCSFSPASVTPPAGGSASSTLTVAVSATATTGTDNFSVVGTSGATSHNASLSINVTPAGGGGGAVTVFFDDFETDQGWTRNPGATDTATTGLWERGDPEQTTDSNTGVILQNGTTPSGVNDLVTAALAGASAGANDVDGGVTSIQSPAITLPSTGRLTLSFASYFAHLNNSTVDDFLRVRVVGTTTATVLNVAGAATNVAGTFATTTADISSFAGQSVRILIDVADNGTGSLVEAAVDDVRITQTPQVTVFADDFETDLGWTRNPGGTDTATTGLWERGVPQATASGGITLQNATTPSGVNDLVTGAAAGATAGDNDVDGGTTSIQSPAITLPATGTLTLSFASYFAHLNNSTVDDLFRVRVVGTTTATVLNVQGAATNVGATFATTTADISGFRGQTIRILIDINDAAGNSVLEAAVDDVKITQQE
jgi:trimeric autotransporter adhesin